MLLQSFEKATGSLPWQKTHSQLLPETQHIVVCMETKTIKDSGGEPGQQKSQRTMKWTKMMFVNRRPHVAPSS